MVVPGRFEFEERNNNKKLTDIRPYLRCYHCIRMNYGLKGREVLLALKVGLFCLVYNYYMH